MPHVGNTYLWDVHSKHSGDRIGRIRWSFGWRQYVLDPDRFTQWSSKCLIQAGEFLDKLNAEHKAKTPHDPQASKQT